MYFALLFKEYHWFPWDPTLDKLTGYSTKMTYVEYWSSWSILNDAYIIDADEELLWVKLKEPKYGSCYTVEQLRDEFQSPYNETIKSYEPPEMHCFDWYEWHNRWSETCPDRLREIQKNFNNSQYFQITYDQFRGMYS